MKRPILPRPLNGTNVVTASDLVRRFGLWQERANREPVYVLHRGRPRLVLTSVEMMQALCAPHEALARDAGTLGAGVDTLLDLMADMLLLVDRDLALIAASRAARRYFGESAQPGTPLADLLQSPNAALLIEAVRRVMASGLAEAIDIGAPFAGRTITVAIDTVDTGACLRISDVTVADELAAMRTAQIADASALSATGLAAIGRINLRGYLEGPTGAIAAMAGVAPESLAGTRFVGLIDIGTRAAVGQAFENAIEAHAPVRVDAQLLVGGAAATPVQIGFGPVARGSTIDAVSVAVVAR